MMITKLLRWVSAACVAALMLSCTMQPAAPAVQEASEGDEIIAGIEVGAVPTRTYTEDLKVLWSEGDMLSVFPRLLVNSQFVLKEGAGETHGVFKKVSGMLTGRSFSGYVAVYPYGDNVALDKDGTVSLVLPAVQTYAEDSFGPADNTMVAWSSNTHLSFFNVGGFLVIPLTGTASICSIEVKALGGEKLSGPAKVVRGLPGPITKVSVEEGLDVIDLLCPEPVQLNPEDTTNFWIVVPPVEMEEGMQVDFVCEDGTVVTKVVNGTVAIERNQIFRMKALELLKKKTALDYVREDYQAIVAAYPEAQDHFVEARFTLNDVIADTPLEELAPETLLTICYYWGQDGMSHIFMRLRDFTTGEAETEYYTADSPWTGDMKIPETELATLAFSLEDALRLVKEDPEASATDGLNTQYVTLRKPLWPVWENPQYVVGGTASRRYHIFVDAVSGVVSTLENEYEPSGETLQYLSDDYCKLLDLFHIDQVLGFDLEVSGCLGEVRYVLNKAFNAAPVSELYPVEATYSFFVPASAQISTDYIAYGKRDFTQGPTAPLVTGGEAAATPWTSGYYVTAVLIDEIISLEEAIYNVKVAPVTDPDTPSVTLAWPKVPSCENPQYIFQGDKTPTVYVDAITGEVTAMAVK